MTEHVPVPVSYDRNSYNVIQGTDLESHDDALTMEQVKRINDRYDIEIHVGMHGMGDETHKSEVSRLPMLPEQYDAAARLVDRLQPGDTLFVENVGFKKADLSSNQDRETLERKRAQGSINAWSYAVTLAALKGITVVSADIDAPEWQVMKAYDFSEAGYPGETINQRFSRRREQAARNIVKDYALRHLSEGSVQDVDGRKPKLAVLFGVLHAGGLHEAFTEAGLDASLHAMEMSETVAQLGQLVVTYLLDRSSGTDRTDPGASDL